MTLELKLGILLALAYLGLATLLTAIVYTIHYFLCRIRERKKEKETLPLMINLEDLDDLDLSQIDWDEIRIVQSMES